MSDVISTGSYGNPDIGSCGVGIVSEGGVIGFGDEALSHISISLSFPSDLHDIFLEILQMVYGVIGVHNIVKVIHQILIWP